MSTVFADTFYWIAFTVPREAAYAQAQSFMLGLDLYLARADKGYSLIDCISMQTV